jgi:hypothetical protein
LVINFNDKQSHVHDDSELSTPTLKFLVRIQGGVRPRRPFCSSLALIGHNQGVGEYVMARDE